MTSWQAPYRLKNTPQTILQEAIGQNNGKKLCTVYFSIPLLLFQAQKKKFTELSRQGWVVPDFPRYMLKKSAQGLYCQFFVINLKKSYAVLY